MKKFILISICLLTSSLIITFGQNNRRKAYNDKTNSKIYYVDIDESKQTMHELLLANDELKEINDKLETDSINPEERHELKLTKAKVNKKIKELILDLKKYMKKAANKDVIEYKRSLLHLKKLLISMSEEEKYVYIIDSIECLIDLDEKINSNYTNPEKRFQARITKKNISLELALVLQNYHPKK